MKKNEISKSGSRAGSFRLFKGITSGLMVLGGIFYVSAHVGAGIQTSEFTGGQQIFSADVSGEANFATGGELTQTLVVGFDSSPVIFEVSNPLAPQAVVCDALSIPGDEGAMLFTESAGTFVAEGIAEISEITIESNN